MDYKKTILKNDLQLLTVSMPHVESVTVMVGVGAGSRYETKNLVGLFHFLEHMAFKGTKKRPSALAISSAIDGVGGEFNASTDKEITLYYVKLAAKHQELAFDILSDMLTNSLFKREEIERDRGVIIEELNMFEDTPMRRILDVFVRLLYGDNPMGWDIGGEKKTIRQIKREDFLNFQEKLYYASNMALIVAGKINEKEIRSLASQYFSGLRKTGQKPSKEIKLQQARPQVKLVSKKTEQAHFCLGVPGFWYSHPDRFVIAVLAAILGGGMSSRLFIQVRERRGLAYYVACTPEFFLDSGFLLARAGVKLEKIDEAIKVCLDQFFDLGKKKVSQKELSKAKEYLKGGLILALEDSKQVAERYVVQALLEERIRTPEEVMKLIDKVTVDDVQKVAKEIFQQKNLNLAIISPYREESRFRKLLGL
ncbi:MAG: M16 family metallopeptidase [Patescibacteria group bacterium]